MTDIIIEAILEGIAAEDEFDAWIDQMDEDYRDCDIWNFL